jgi:hypothetical protein
MAPLVPGRRYAERGNNIVHWTEFDRGHLAAMEAPDLLVGDVRRSSAATGDTAGRLATSACRR